MIDTSGKWWVGSEATDIADYLTAYKAEGYEVQETRLCKCDCGSITFELGTKAAPTARVRSAAPSITCATAPRIGRRLTPESGLAPNANAKPASGSQLLAL